MSDEARLKAERAQEIERKIREGVPFERIFPVRRRVDPRQPREEGYADFIVADMPSPHGGSVMRSYILDCAHGKVELSLMGYTEDRDGEVLGNMLNTLRTHAAEAGKLCLCWPKGWRAG